MHSNQYELRNHDHWKMIISHSHWA